MKYLSVRRIVSLLLLGGLILIPSILVMMERLPGKGEDIYRTGFTMLEQVLIFAAAFVIKPLYLIASATAVWLLRKCAAPELIALRWGMLAFFAGENACTVNYLFFQDQSIVMEFFHTYGMVVCFGLVMYALMEAFDKRLFYYSGSDKKCVLLPLCRGCYKYRSSPCNLRQLFLLIIPATAACAAIPLTAPLGIHMCTGNIFGTPVIFGQPMMYQLLEARIYPLISLPAFGLSFFILLIRGEKGFDWSKIFYAMGLGMLGFSLLRFIFYWGYQQDPLWGDAWEEITELLFSTIVLWSVIKIGVIPFPRADTSTPAWPHST